MIDPDHAKRVLANLEKQQGKTPQVVIAKWLAKTNHPSPYRMNEALSLINDLVKAGYAIEPIEDDDED